MAVDKNNLRKILLVVLFLLLADSCIAAEPWGKTEGHGLATLIFKSTDDRGKVTYSSVAPDDFIQVEEIDIVPPPSLTHAQVSKQRSDEIKAAAEKLSRARAEREAAREQKKQKRLRHLASSDQSEYPVFYPRFTYLAYPHRFKTKTLNVDHHDRANYLSPIKRRISRLPLPISSFPSASGR